MAAATSGIHAGFLWKVGEEGAIYLTDDCGTCSPLSNPKLLEAVEKAHQVVFATLGSLETGDVPDRERCRGYLTAVAQKLEKYWSPREIDESIAKLEKWIEEGSARALSKKAEYVLREITHPYERFVYLFAWVVGSSTFPHRMREEGISPEPEELLKQKADALGKECILLSPDGEYENHLLEGVTLLFNTPSFHPIVKEIFLSEKGIALWKKGISERGRAWDFGAFSLYKKRAFSELDLYLNSLGERKKIESLDEELLEKLKDLHDSYTQRLVEKICTFLQRNPKVLISVPALFQKDLLSALVKRDIQMQGPLKEAIKPRGFLWQICDKTDRVVGYFLGSIHITPRWILDHMNSKILHAFEWCDTLGVEVDITREGVSEALDEEKKLSEEALNSLFLGIFVLGGIEEYGLAFEGKGRNEILQKGFWRVIKSIFAEQGLESGIDHFFIDKAKKRSIPIVELESLETHKEFSSLVHKEISRGLSVQPPIGSWDSKEIYQEMKRLVVKGVMNYPEIVEMGSIEALEIITAKNSPEMLETVNRRNMEMALSTDRLIRQKKKPFSIEGANHFSGPLATQKLMEQMGYKVTQIICEELRE
jgi:uncharacterized protein YbaP (TraB family)